MYRAVAVLMSLGSLVALGWCLWILYRGFVSLRWPSVMGDMLAASVEEENDGDFHTCYRLKVRYLYKVDGRTYSAERCRIHDFCIPFRWGQNRLRKRFAAGTRAIVYYKPENPNEAVLIRGFPWPALVLIGILFVVNLEIYEAFRSHLI